MSTVSMVFRISLSPEYNTLLCHSPLTIRILDLLSKTIMYTCRPLHYLTYL